MEKLLITLNILFPEMWDEGWTDPLQIVSALLSLVLFAVFLWFFFGVLPNLADNLIDKALDKIKVQPLTEREDKEIELFQRVRWNEKHEQGAQNFAKVASIILGAFFVFVFLYVLVSTDWVAWYEERKYFLWFIAVFVAFIVVSSVGAWIDKKGKRVSVPVFLMIAAAVCFVVYQLIP